MKLKRFDDYLIVNEEIKDYYPEMTELAKEITDEIEDKISSMNLKKDDEYNLYVCIYQWGQQKARKTDGGYWTSNQPG
jgi:hypothetical protein